MPKEEKDILDRKIKLELDEYLRRIADSYRWRKVIMRGIVQGIFTAFGATVGFAIFLLLLSRVYIGLRGLPIIDDILKETRLDVLIEKQINTIDEARGEEETSTETPNPDKVDNNSYIHYQSDILGIEFNYPGNLVNFSEKYASKNKEIVLTGDGDFLELGVHKNPEDAVELNVDKITQYVNNASYGEVRVEIYELGIDASNRPAYIAEVEIERGGTTEVFRFIGYAKESSPKVGREIFKKIIESVK